MEARQKNHIEENLVDLILLTYPQTSLLAYLRSKGFLSMEDVEMLEAQEVGRSRMNAVKRFYEVMVTRNNAYSSLIEALERSQQTGAAAILKQLDKKPDDQLPQQSGGDEILDSVEEGLKKDKFDESGPSDDGVDKRKKRKLARRLSNSELTRRLIEQPERTSVNIVKQRVFPSLKKDFYNLPSGFKGYALILNIIQYKKGIAGKEYREGAEVDSLKLKELFTQLGYKVILYDDRESEYTDDDIRNIVFSFKEYMREMTPASVIVFIGGHGDMGHIQASNRLYVSVEEDVVHQFNNTSCPELNEKPKIFIFQCCRGVRMDGDEERINNAIVCYATSAGDKAARNELRGSYYVNALIEVISQNPNNLHFTNILLAAQDILNVTRILYQGAYYIQRSTHENFNFNRLYFNLG